MNLLELQRDIRDWLVREDMEAAHRIGRGALPGLRVYQNNYRAQLVSCLEATFAQTLRWIGGDELRQAAAVHIERVPPSSWTLDAYPRDFPETLAMLYPDDPEVAELAWIDLALDQAFVGPDASVIDAADLAGVDWDHVLLCFTPTLDLRPAVTNAPEIWSALAANEVPPAAELLNEPGAILVWRREQRSRFRAIDQYEYQALLRVRAGLSFSEFCAGMVEAFGEEQGVARAGRMLGVWLADALVSEVRIRDGVR